MRPSFSIGIEEEYQTIDPVTRDLRSHIDAEIIEKGKIRQIEAVLLRAPYGMMSGWSTWEDAMSSAARDVTRSGDRLR